MGIAQKVLLGSLVVVLAAVGFLGGLWIYRSYQSFEQISQQARADFVARKNRDLVDNVQRALEFIEFNRRRMEMRLQKELMSQVDQALAMARSLENSLSGHPMAERKRVLADLLRSIHVAEGLGYYFAIDLGGKVWVYRPNQAIEGGKISDFKDRRGKPVIESMLEAAKSQGGGFIHYRLPQRQNGVESDKLAYFKLYKPLGWVIAVGFNLADRQRELQKEVLKSLGKVQFGREGYLFAGTWDGDSLLGPGAGNNILEVTDKNGKKVVRELIETARQGGGFVSYHQPPIESVEGGQRTDLQVSYVAPVSLWRWYLGAGYYVDDIEKKIEENQKALTSQVKRTILNIVLVMAFLVLLAVFVVRYLSRLVSRELAVFQKFFRRAATELTLIDESEINSPVLRGLASSANQMVLARRASEAEKQAVEDQLRQSQKLEALGTLTGGIAHDFNNILQAITGYTHLILMDKALSDKARDYSQEISRAAERARDLVGRLMAFSRRGEPSLLPLDLNQVVQGALRILSRTIPPMIRINTRLEDRLWAVAGDAGQMEQVLVNLGANAGDAMPEGGDLTIGTQNLVLAENDVKMPFALQAGHYVVLTVADNGQGMDQQTQARVFEPFFTTKALGKGTGLGLSTVYGIVKAHGGWVNCESEPGAGTMFQVYLPASDERPQGGEPTGEQSRNLPTGSGRVLVVDDEEALLKFAREGLCAAGYQVFMAQSGEEALLVWQDHKGAFDLVVMDLGMPGMGGKRCLVELKRLDPELRVLVASGYSLSKKEYKSLEEAGAQAFMQKPYRLADLLRAVRAALDSPAGRQG